MSLTEKKIYSSFYTSQLYLYFVYVLRVANIAHVAWENHVRRFCCEMYF